MRTMWKKLYESGGLFVVIGVLLGVGAAGKIVTKGASALFALSLAALLFLVAGLLQFARRTASPGTRFTRMDEFYEALAGLIDWLKRDGYPDEAHRLETLMQAAWTTGSELLGELTPALDNMKGQYSKELRVEIDQCRSFARHHRQILRLR